MNDSLFQDQEKEIKSYRELLVGEGKKFKDDEEVAKGKYYADAAIAIKDKQLDEQRELILKQREQIDTSKSLEELLDQLKQRELASSENTPAKEVKETKPMNYEETVRKIIQAEKQAEKAMENLKIVQDKLQEQFGDKALEVLSKRVNDLGLTKDDVDNLARRSPAAVMNVLGLSNQQQKESFQSPPRSEVRNDSFKPNVDKHTWSWYKSKYKNRDFITNKEINVQMAKDAAALGDAFYDGDFYNAYHKEA